MGPRDFTLADMLRRNAALHGDGTALVDGETRLTHRALLARVVGMAGRLAAAGLGRGERVALVAQNGAAFVDVVGAAALLGAVVVPVNWRLEAGEIAHAIRDTAPRLVLADQDFLPTLAPLRPDLPDVAGWHVLSATASDGFEPLPEGRAVAPPSGVAAGDGLVVVHTAAIGGRARGALLTHANILANASQFAGAWALGPGDVALGALPLFHVSGLGLLFATLFGGGATVLMPRFDPAVAASLIRRESVTLLFEFAPMLGQMLDAAVPGALASLRHVWGLDSPETIARFEESCPEGRFFVGYGQSETSGLVTLAPHREAPGTAGRALPLCALAIHDEADRPVPEGTTGEIAVRGPAVFAGYWGLPDDTALASRGGWHRTGDLGSLSPDGVLTYRGRSPAKDLIKTGGENVYPAEVEAALLAHPDVAEAVVFGVPDPDWGEAVRAVCVATADRTLEGPALAAFVGERIARFKRPKRVVVVSALPRNDAGGIDRLRVKAEHGGA